MSAPQCFELPSGHFLNTQWSSTASVSAIDAEIAAIDRYVSRLHTRRNLLTCPLLSLHPDVLDLLFNFLHAFRDRAHSKLALRNCSSTCSALRLYARPRLFSSLRLVDTSTRTRALKFSSICPELYACTQTLTLCDALDMDADEDASSVDTTDTRAERSTPLSPEIADDAYSLSGPAITGPPSKAHKLLMPLSVRALQLERIRGHCQLLATPAHASVRALFAGVSRLTLRGCVFSDVASFRALVEAFPGVEALDLCGAVIKRENGTGAGVIPFRAPCISPRSLAFFADRSVREMRAIRAALCDAITPGALRALQLELPHDQEGHLDDFASAVVQDLGTELSEIHLSASYPLRAARLKGMIDDEMVTDIYRSMAGSISQHSNNIRSLTVCMNLNLSSMRDSFRFLRTLSLPYLDSVSFIMERWGTQNPVLPLTPNAIKDIARLLAKSTTPPPTCSEPTSHTSSSTPSLSSSSSITSTSSSLWSSSPSLKTVHFDFCRNVYDARMRVPYDDLHAVLLAAGCSPTGFFVPGPRQPSWEADSLADQVDEYDLGPLLGSAPSMRRVLLRVNIRIDDVAARSERRIATMMFVARAVS